MVVTGNKVQLTVIGGPTPLAIVRGGGISNFGTLTVRDSTVSGNTVQATGTGGTTSNGASANGGGIYSQGPGALTIEGSTVSGNHLSATATGINPSAGSEGGGIFNATFGSFSVIRSTITGNINAASGGGPADTNGGGIFDDSLKLRATGDTIAANSGAPAANLTGAVMITPGEHTADTILADPLGGGANCDGVVLSDGFNLEDDGSCSLNASTDVHAPAGLAPLGSNGGPTQTMALTPGSAAIDRGSAFGAAADQRGSPRISDFGAIGNAADASDIGAFELRDSFPPQTKIRKVKRKNGRTKITFSSSEAGSTFLCRLDRKRFKPCRSPVTLKHLRPGKKHRFQVEAVDVAGNVDPSPARVKFKKT